MVQLEEQIEDDKALVLAAAEASAQAKDAVERNAEALRQTLAERQKLLSQLDQAKMQEQINAAMASVTETSGSDTPSVDQVRRDIETRYARARGMSELVGQGQDATMREVESASRSAAASARLEEIRASLAISAPAPAELDEA
jgi:phage shock protein A